MEKMIEHSIKTQTRSRKKKLDRWKMIERIRKSLETQRNREKIKRSAKKKKMGKKTTITIIKLLKISEKL